MNNEQLAGIFLESLKHSSVALQRQRMRVLEHCHFKNLSYTEFRGRGGAAEAVIIFNHLIACLDFFCISYKIQHAAKGQTQ